MKRIEKTIFGSRFKAGAYSAFAAVLIIVLAVAVNLLAGSLPETQTQVDLTRQSLYTLSEQSKQIVSSLARDVDIYLLANTGNENPIITRMLNRYAALSKHVHVTNIDPTAQPTFLKDYDLSTANMNENSLLIDCAGKHRLVDYSEIFVPVYEMDAETGGYIQNTVFDGEQAITNAIHYVSKEDLPKVYILKGHGETALSAAILKMMEQDNILTEEANLLSMDSIPADADLVLLHRPKNDLSPEEAERLTAYLEEGGRMALVTDYIEDGDMENLLSVAAAMGMQAGNGLIIEGNANMCISQYAYYLLPELSDHEITWPLKAGRYYVMMPVAQPIEQSGNTGALVSFLLTTSGEAYLKKDGLRTTDFVRADGDASGPFHVAALAELGEGKLCWFTAGDMISDAADRTVSGANSDLFMNAVNFLIGQEESVSVRAKSLSAQGLTLTEADHSFWSIMMIGVIPLVLIGCGIIILIRRRKR